MAKLIDPDTFRHRYFERVAPTDEELRAGIETGKIRGCILAGKIWVADDALHNSEPWRPEVTTQNPLLAGRMAH